MGASIFDSALSHTRRSDASEKREENSVSTLGRLRLWTIFESSPVSVNLINKNVPLINFCPIVSFMTMKLKMKLEKEKMMAKLVFVIYGDT